MKISIEWLNDYVEIPKLSAKEIGEKFTLATAEVEGVVETGAHLEKICVVEIKKITPHPDADKLNLVTFSLGKGDDLQVVCGASNVKVGMRVPYAPIGTSFPDGLVLTPKKIRGIVSEGMLCSTQELGLTEDSSGLMDLGPAAPLGQNMLTYLEEKKDIILDVDNKSLTHRPDLWGHFGIAREFATIFKSPLKDRFTQSWELSLTSKFTKDRSPITPRIDGDCSCLGYYGLNVDGVVVNDSPRWLQRRLIAAGLRPINNIVDISNYVMLELGNPLHIFDRDLISGSEVIIKKSGASYKFITLDEVEREIVPADTVICDKSGALVLGGIMGGLNCGVSTKTTKIFIEVANWKAVDIRKTSTRLGLRTDSSMRFEKTLDTLMCKRAMLRTLELILEICPKARVVGSLEYAGPSLINKNPLVINTSVEKICSVLGHQISAQEIKRIFTSLGFGVEESGNKLQVTVPSYRATKDVEFEADLIEEIGRIVGYDNMPPLSPSLCVKPISLSPTYTLHRKIRSFLTLNSSAYEIMTYPLVGKDLLEKCFAGENRDSDLVILNSLSNEHDRMRPSMIPSLLEASAVNVKNLSSFKMFEIGRSYLSGKNEDFASERSQLGIVFFDKESTPYIDLLNSCERLLNHLGINFQIISANNKFKNPLIPSDWAWTHPFENLDIKIMGKSAGIIFSCHPMLLSKFKIKGHLSVMIIDLNEIEEKPLKDKVKYKPLSKYPCSTFDWTVLAKKGSAIGDILSLVNKTKIKEMESCLIVDIFALDDIHDAITLRAAFSDPEKTLDGEFLKSARERLVNGLEKAGYPLKV